MSIFNDPKKLWDENIPEKVVLPARAPGYKEREGKDIAINLEKDLDETIKGYSKKENFDSIESMKDEMKRIEEELLKNDVKAIKRLKMIEDNQLKIISHLGLVTEHIEKIVTKIDNNKKE